MRWTPRTAALALAVLLTSQPVLAQRASSPAGDGALKLSFGSVMFEAGSFSQSPQADAAFYLRASPYALWQPHRDWELRLGAHLRATEQSGGASPHDDATGVLGDTYVRYRTGDTRVTLGTQTILWGRVDAVPTIDRVSRADLQRFALDDLQDRRLPQLALRVEQSLGDYRLDTVLLPRWRGADLPDERSVWSPVNRRSGEVIGIEPSAAMSMFLAGATIREDRRGSGGAAVRLTRTGVEPVDFGLTLARTRQPLPYYRLDAADQALTVVHPYNTFAGIDAEFTAKDVTWRTELSWTRGVAVTLPTGAMARARQTEWVAGAELFPGGGDTRLTLQLMARWLHAHQTVLELKRYVGVNGELESNLAQGRWRFSLRFFGGINVRDLYLAPKISFVGWEPHEFYLTARSFDGEARTLGGFHRAHDMVAIGVKTRF